MANSTVPPPQDSNIYHSAVESAWAELAAIIASYAPGTGVENLNATWEASEILRVKRQRRKAIYCCSQGQEKDLS